MNSQSLWLSQDAAADNAIVELSPVVADQIAAGEVVERPASVIKELVENAFDAQATHVDVHIRGGGLEEIRVEDDGFGMGPKDAQLCFKRHATSKLRTLDDLGHLRSFGFRGEALSSIASVSTMDISTRCAAQSAGAYVQLVAGEVKNVADVGRGVGTSMRVKELFFNTPGRRKFMRSAATEQAHVIRALQQVVLGRPGVGVRLVNEKRCLLDIRSDASTKERLLGVLSRQVSDLIETYEAHEGVGVRVFRAEPMVSRKDSKGIWVFLNGRFIRDRLLQKAILDAFTPESLGGYPTLILYVELDPAAFDVNVHPQKVEVRFLEPSRVYHAVGLALRQGVPLIEEGQTQTNASVKRALYDFYRQERPNTAPQAYEPGALKSYLGQARAQGRTEVGRTAQVERPAAVFVAPYMLMSGDEALILMDCKRLAQEHFRAHMTQALCEVGLLEKQKLMLPQVIDLSAAAWACCSAHLDLFAQVGLEIREVGASRIALNAIPKHLDEEKSFLISEWFKETLEKAEAPLSQDMLPLWIEALLPFVQVAEDMDAFERLFAALERLPVLAQQEILAKAQRYVEPGEVAKLFAAGTQQVKDA